MNATEIPIDLKELLQNEKTDFIIKAKRHEPLRKSVGGVFIGLAMCAFISMFVFAFFNELFEEEEVYFESNDSELILPGLIIFVLLSAGIYVLISGIISLFKEGGYFVGTETRLIHFRKGKTTITDWEQFTGNVKIKAKNNFGDLEYQLRTGKTESRKNGPDVFVPDIIYIAAIENVYEIERKCKIRIKENDPTPAVAVS
ncbi:hypothetical protein ACFFLS_25110 [Flavobacterium procerum]|uniref:DUF304 domain-containing protein n=1 Tax=Flavobacterium procerum TaxID=1455569 RepID=A0ABV6BY24_9FLAO